MRLQHIMGGVLLALSTAVTPTLAADWPQNRPVRVLVGYAAGGPTDTQARVIADALSNEIGTSVIVENMPGGSGTIAVRNLISSEPDGHTLLYTIDGPLTQLPHTMKNLGYDPLNDVVPVTRASLGGSVLLVHSSIPANDLKSFIEWAKQNRGKLSYASYGVGTLAHIYGAVLNDMFDLDMSHVPYKGSADAMRDLVSGRVQLMFDAPATSLAFVEKGQLKRLASTGDTRRPLIPDLPTMKEQGVEGFELRSFNGFYAPKGISPGIVEKINAAIQNATRSKRVQDVWKIQGFEHIYETPADFARAYRAAYDQWGKYLRDLGIAID